MEAGAELNDAVLGKFFDNPDTSTPREVNEAVRKVTIALKFTPMMCGSSFKNKGVQTMLDAVCKFLPAPSDVPAVQGTNPDTGNEETRKPDPDDKFAALAFKIMTDPFVGRLAFFRVYSGGLDAGSYVLNTRTIQTERISRIMQLHANKQNPTVRLQLGDPG